MGNYKTRGQLVLLDNHLASGTESTYTWTPTSAILKTKYTQIIIIMSGESSAALALQLLANSETSGYYVNSQENATDINIDAAALAQLISNTAIAAAMPFHIEIHINIDDLGYTIDNLGGTFQGSVGTPFSIHGAFRVGHSVSGLATYTLKTSTSTWKAGTRILTYGLKL